MRVGGADVFEAAQMLDDGPVDLLAAAHQLQADALLRQQLADGQKHGHRDDADHDEAEQRLLADGGGQGENRR